MMRAPILLLQTLAFWALQRPAAARSAPLVPEREITYVSTDLHNIVVFDANGAHYGRPLVDSRPESPSHAPYYFEPSEGVRCVSNGPAAYSVEYAVKRPIRAGDRYQCRATSFRVVRCFRGCRAALVQRVERLVNNRRRTSTMYVSSCLGILAFSEIDEMTDGIPFDAPVLRGEVGVLADPSYPDCRSF